MKFADFRGLQQTRISPLIDTAAGNDGEFRHGTCDEPVQPRHTHRADKNTIELRYRFQCRHGRFQIIQFFECAMECGFHTGRGGEHLLRRAKDRDSAAPKNPRTTPSIAQRRQALAHVAKLFELAFIRDLESWIFAQHHADWNRDRRNDFLHQRDGRSQATDFQARERSPICRRRRSRRQWRRQRSRR